MILRRRIKNLERKLNPAGDFEREKAAVTTFVRWGILPDNTDVNEATEDLLNAGISFSDMIREVIEEIDGSNRGLLPCQEED
jgi:hypothetical protein